MKGLLIGNTFLNTSKFTEHYDSFFDACKKRGIELVFRDNASFIQCYTSKEKQDYADELSVYDFVIFWDKDIMLGNWLEMHLKQYNIPMFNCISGIAASDDKSVTIEKIAEYNACNTNQISIPDTVISPMTYEKVGYTNLDFLNSVISHLDFPMVVKESFGSFGQQVYLVDNLEHLEELVRSLGGAKLIFQEYIKASHGVDVRLQVVGDQVVAGMKRKSSTADFRANLTNGGTMEPYVWSEEEEKLAVKSAKILGLDFAGVDLLFGHGEENRADILCEINSNAHFHNITQCTGVDVAEAIISYIVKQVEH